jgi:hypothetical protein
MKSVLVNMLLIAVVAFATYCVMNCVTRWVENLPRILP